MRSAILPVAAVAVVAALGAGALQLRGDDPAGRAPAPLGLADVTRAPAGAPPVLARLRRDANALRPGGARALDARLRELRGHPVVVNVWASWCPPCRRELPHFQRQALKRGAEVAFLGVDSGDERGDARALLRRYPLPYPSFEDPRQAVAGRFGIPGLPATAFYDARGRRVLVHQGAFASERQLAAEIERYALGAATG